MKIRLDGKDNIIDQAYADLSDFNTESKGPMTEKEMQKLVKEINEKVEYDYYNKPVIRIKQTQESDYTTKSLEKARVTKYYKRVPKASGKGYDYYYTKSQYDKAVKQEDKKEEKSSWINKFAGFFGFKDKRQVMQKIEADYKDNQIDKKYGLTWDGWKDHLSEYFLHKDKWDNLFSEKKDKKEKKAVKKEKKEKKDIEKKVKKDGIKLSVMKELFNLYGAKPEDKEIASQMQALDETQVSQPVQLVEPEDNFDTMPETKTIETKNGSKIKTNVKLDKEQKKAEIDNEETASREGYYNEKPADILNVGKDVFGAARHNFTTYEVFDADIASMEKDGTATAYVTKKNLLDSYGLANKNERVANGETEYKVIASFAVKDFLNKIPQDTPESRKKYMEFSRSIVRLDNNTNTAQDFLLGLAENFELSFPQIKTDTERESLGTKYTLSEDKDNKYNSSLTIGLSLKAFFNTLTYPGYKRDYYFLDKKGKKQFTNLTNILLSETGKTENIKTYEQLKVDVLGATKASGLKIKKGDNVLLSDAIKEKVYVTQSTVLDQDGWERWKDELGQIYKDPAYLPDSGDSFYMEQTLQDHKGETKTFKDDIQIDKVGENYITYKTKDGNSGLVSVNNFMQKIVHGSISIKNIQNPDKKKTIDLGLEKVKGLYLEEIKYITRTRIYPETSGQVAKAGKKDIIVSFTYPDGKIRNLRFDPSEIKPENIENVKKSVNKKETFKPNLFVESNVVRDGGKDFSELSISSIQKELEQAVKTKSLQYGNSMPDDERMAHSRWTLESFSDLSDILGIPLQQISVNGKLGMAFGARGKSGALAHYEPGTKMINITRGNGFGSLAHEWGHFLDNMLSKDMQSFITRTPDYEKESKSFPEMQHGDVYVYKARRKKSPVGDRYFYDKNAKDPRYPFAKLAEGQTEPDEKSSYVSFYWQNAKNPDGLPLKVEIEMLSENNINSKALEIAKKSKEALHSNADKEGGETGIKIKQSKYLNDSAELFARSFECYIADKLEDNGRKNTYLASKGKTIYEDGALVYPQGEIRKGINKMFDDFFNELRQTDDLKKAIDSFSKGLTFIKKFNPENNKFEYRRKK